MKGETFFIVTLLLVSFLSEIKGQRWTDDEIRIVTIKLNHTFAHQRRPARDFKGAVNTDSLEYEFREDVWMSAAKVVRLGFHDCLPYQEAPGNGFANGCDGCLNNHNMGVNMITKYAPDGGWDAPVPFETDNNGLWATADYLELIYTRTDFPRGTPRLQKSLKDAGRSRADLWAFAYRAAVIYSFDVSNRACDGHVDTDLASGNLRMEESDCKIPEHWTHMRFKFGRKDCEENDQSSIRPFFTSRKEIHPNTVATGDETIQFYKKNFNLDEGWALALHGGAHSMGQMHDSISTYKYEWVKRQRTLLNNQFLRMLDEQPSYSMGKADKHNTLKWAALVGDQYGKPGKRGWMVINSRRNRTVGGSFQWFCTSNHCQSGECGNINKLPPFKTPCCQDLEEGKRCKDECVEYRDNDMEAAMLADVGLVYDFQVDPVNGRPIGCPGLQWKNDEKMAHFPQCKKGKYSGTVKRLANNQEFFTKRFVQASQIMLANGYGAGELVDM